MRLNALHPEDNPMEALLFCFGGDGGGGGGGGGSDDPDDADSMDSGYDTGTVGSGTNTDMGGGGDNNNNDNQDSQMDDLDAISAEFDAMDEAYDAGESFTSEGVETGGGNNDMGPGGGGYVSGDIEDEQMAELDAITQQFEDMNRAIEETGGAAIGGDGSVSGRGTEGYEAVADTYEGMTGDDSMTAGYPTETLQAGLVPDITITVPKTQDELMDELDAISEQFEAMNDVIDTGQGVAITGSGEVTTVEGYNEAKDQAIRAAVDAYIANPDIQNQTTLNPNDPENLTSLENKLGDMSLAQIDTFTRSMGGLTAEEQSYTVPYNFEVVDTVKDLQNLGTGTGMPISNLDQGTDYVMNDDGTISLTSSGSAKSQAFSQALAGQDNPYGITKEEAESIQQEGSLYGTPTITVTYQSPQGDQGSTEGSVAQSGEGEDEAGLAGGMGGAGRLGEDTFDVEGLELGYDYPDYTGQGEYAVQAKDTSGLGISPESGGIGLIPGEGGIIGTDSGLVGQSGSGSINPFTEGGESGSGDTGSGDQGTGEVGAGEGGGDGAGTGTPPTVADGGDGGDTTVPPVVEEPVIPYFFGEPMEFYDPNLPPFEYRTPLVTTPYDFARDFGSYTLSEPIAESYAQRALIAPEGLIPYTPEYMEPIAEMDELRQAELLSLIGERFPGEFGEFDYDMSVSPLESAQALIDALGNQSS